MPRREVPTLLRLLLRYVDAFHTAGVVALSGYYFWTLRPDVLLVGVGALPIIGDILRYTVSPLLNWPEVTNWPPGTHKPRDGLSENPSAEVSVHSANPTGFSAHEIGPFSTLEGAICRSTEITSFPLPGGNCCQISLCVPGGRFVSSGQPAAVRQAAQAREMRPAAALAPAGGALEAHAGAEFVPVLRIKRAEFRANRHGSAPRRLGATQQADLAPSLVAARVRGLPWHACRRGS